MFFLLGTLFALQRMLGIHVLYIWLHTIIFVNYGRKLDNIRRIEIDVLPQNQQGMRYNIHYMVHHRYSVTM